MHTGNSVDQPLHALFTNPPDGAILHNRSGRPSESGLEIELEVSFEGPAVESLWVGGTRLRGSGQTFSGRILISAGKNELVARAGGPDGPSLCSSRVYYDRGSFPRYRFAIDDNIFFLEQIARDRPRSLFDCFYLKGLRDLHDRYGAKFALNLFFETPDGSFRLDSFPGDYKREFADNADWLTLAFHARREFPDRPYLNCEPDELASDYDVVANEILRFAGAEAYSPTTVIHWASTRSDAWPVLRQKGSRILTGIFAPVTDTKYTTDGENLPRGGAPGRYDGNYGMDDRRSAILSARDLLADPSSGVLFSKADIVCNNIPATMVEDVLGPLAGDASTCELMDLVTHEQYFWPHYPAWRADHFERCEAAIRFCADRGYRPVFLHHGLAGSETGGDFW